MTSSKRCYRDTDIPISPTALVLTRTSISTDSLPDVVPNQDIIDPTTSHLAEGFLSLTLVDTPPYSDTDKIGPPPYRGESSRALILRRI